MTATPADDAVAAFLASKPAAVPAPWRWELVLIAAETALFAPAHSSSLGALAWIVPTWSAQKALLAVRENLERARARELGLQRTGDLPPALRQLPRMPIPVNALSESARAPILLASPIHPFTTGATLLLATAVTALRRRRGNPPPPRRWEDALGLSLANALLRRWDWRAAGGPR